MNNGILENIHDQLVKFNENVEKLLSIQPQTVQPQTVQAEEVPATETPKKTTKKPAAKKVEEPVKEEVEKVEEPKVEEPVKEEASTEAAISDDDLKKVVFEAKKRNVANLGKAKEYITEKGLSKITEIEQSERQAFIDYMESL